VPELQNRALVTDLRRFLILEQLTETPMLGAHFFDNNGNMSKGNARATSLEEPAVWELQDILTMALESSPHAVMLEAEGRVTHANQAFAKLMRASSVGEIIGCKVCKFCDGEDCKRGTPTFHSETGKHYQHKLVELCANGRKLRIHLAFDVSERRNLEKELSDTRKLQSFGLLVSGIAHDFNNVLTAVTLHAGLLSTQLEKGTWAWRQADSIRGAAERGTSLVGQLLAYLREQSPDPEEVNVDHVLRQMETILRPLIGEQIEFVVAAHCGKATVVMVPSQLQQIIMNLVINARDAMDGSGRIVLESGTCVLREGNQYKLPAGHYVQLTVADTGRGMDATTKAKMFEAFYSTKKSSNGTGLGLFTVHSIVRKNGGAINVTSEPGRGTRIEVFLAKTPALHS
jgi:C4-dicarboxylate-specific signal transduction histidine kinase